MNCENISSEKPQKLLHLIDFKQQQDGLGRLQLTNIIKFYFQFLYYLGFCPFRFEMNSNAYFSKKVWKPQQVFCGFLHILCVFRLFSQAREWFPDNLAPLRKNPTAYFSIFLVCAYVLHKMVLMKRFWFNGNDYVNVLNTVLNEHYLPVRKYMHTKTSCLSILYGFFLLKISACFVAGFTLFAPISSWTPSWWLRRLVAQSKFTFCFSSLPGTKEAPEISSITFGDGCLAFLMALSNVTRLSLTEFCDLLVFAFALTLWTTARSFACDVNEMLKISDDDMFDMESDIKNREMLQVVSGLCSHSKVAVQRRIFCDPWTKMYKSFQAIQSVSEVVNIAMGTQATWFLLEGLMYYSIYLNTVFITTDWFERMVKIIYTILAVITLYISADICNQMESVRSWLVKKNNIKRVPIDEANLVLHEIITKDIGIRGSNIFTITFSLLAGYLSLMVTYFIMCVQQSVEK